METLHSLIAENAQRRGGGIPSNPDQRALVEREERFRTLVESSVGIGYRRAWLCVPTTPRSSGKFAR